MFRLLSFEFDKQDGILTQKMCFHNLCVSFFHNCIVWQSVTIDADYKNQLNIWSKWNKSVKNEAQLTPDLPSCVVKIKETVSSNEKT